MVIQHAWGIFLLLELPTCVDLSAIFFSLTSHGILRFRIVAHHTLMPCQRGINMWTTRLARDALFRFQETRHLDSNTFLKDQEDPDDLINGLRTVYMSWMTSGAAWNPRTNQI